VKLALGNMVAEITRHEKLADGRFRVWFPSGADLIVQAHHLGARNTDPATSHKAAASHRSWGDSHWAVLTALAAAGDTGMLDHEHQPINRLQQDTAGKRRGELVESGLVAPSGWTRKTPRGSDAMVWVITAKGRELLRQRVAS
jgi:hypothetical protein